MRSQEIWLTQSTLAKFKPNSRTLQEHFWSSGSSMCTENSDWHQKHFMSQSMSSTNFCAERRWRRAPYTWSEFPRYSLLLSMKKSIHQTSRISWWSARTCSPNQWYSRWKGISWWKLIGRSLHPVPTGSWKDSGGCRWLWTTTKYSSTPSTCKKFLCWTPRCSDSDPPSLRLRRSFFPPSSSKR